MDFNNKFYKQWKTKSKSNHQLFLEKLDFPVRKLLQTDQIFSSTTLENETETETFSLRLSESYVDETQESLEFNFEQNQVNETIVISDSSSNESIFTYDKLQLQKDINILEVCEDESCMIPVKNAVSKTFQNINNISKMLIKENKKKKVVNEENDSEIEQNRVSQIIKESVSESITLSERKKKEIIQWLSTNFDGSIHGSSCSYESIISNSRKSDVSSGNSSLERLELNFETPNNRGKLLKSNKIIQKEFTKQTTLDQYFMKSKKEQLNIVKDKISRNKNSNEIPINIKVNPRRLLVHKSELKDSETPTSKNSDKTPITILKTNSRLLVNESESKGSETPRSKISDKTPISIIKTNSRKTAISEIKSFDFKSLENNTKENSNKRFESEFLDFKTSESKNYVKTPIKNINSNKIVISESESFDSKTPESNNSDRIPVSYLNRNSNRIISESESFDSKTSESNNSDRIPVNKIKTNFKKIIPELHLHETNNSINVFKRNYLRDQNKTVTNTPLLLISETVALKYNDVDADNKQPLYNSSDLKNKIKNKKNISTINNTINSTINDCADILENLYGKSWRDKASTLISATEPKKEQKKLFKNIQTEENITFTQSRYNWKSNNDLSDNENFCKNSIKYNKTLTNSKNLNGVKDSFINNDSTTESSPDCSYYTALTNPRSSQNNQLKIVTPSTIQLHDKNKKNELLIYDSVSNVNKKNFKNRNNQRKLSFSSSSSTSEFDPEDIVLPKTVSKSINIKKFTKFESTIQKVNKQLEERETKRSFLASLSKDVPLENANFQAMVYRVKYNVMKEELCKVLFKLFNEQIFDNHLPDDMLIEWSSRLRGTAGKCYNKQSVKAFNNTVRSSRIVLASKILDSPDRLRDTLIHEMCHAATWLINNISDGHGSFWKAWANKATKVFPELPFISRCHNYEIQTKYTYKCTTCGYNIGRHSKSLDLNKKRCGYCHGRFELLINKITKNGKMQKKSSAQTKEPSGFALYVKENYQLVKQSRAAVKHGEVMKILGKQFSAIKITPKSENCSSNNKMT